MFFGKIRFAGLKADRNHIFRQCRAVISWNTGTVKYPSKQVIGEGHHHWSAEEADGIAGSDTLCTCKYLKRYQVFIKFYNSRITVTYESQIAQADIRCSDSNYVTDD